jgi:hypothetical protein
VNEEAPGSSETLIAIYQTTRYHVPQDYNFGKGIVGRSARLFNLRKYLTNFDEMFSHFMPNISLITSDAKCTLKLNPGLPWQK